MQVPPLRERVADILPLASSFLSQERTRARGFAAEARALLVRYGWPGNVRELQNAVKHGAALALGREIKSVDLPEELLAPSIAASSSFLRPLREVEREHILSVLDSCGGSQAEAARALGIGRNTLWRKLREYR